MNNEQQLHQIEITLAKAKERLALADALERLHQNPDFKAVILEEFFKEEASRAVMLKSDPNMFQTDQQKIVDNIIIGVGSLFQYFGKVYALADQAARAMEADQDTREELLQEGLVEEEL